MRNIFGAVEEKKLFQAVNTKTLNIGPVRMESPASQVKSEAERMSASQSLSAAGRPTTRTSPARAERRQMRRASVNMPVRIRMADTLDRKFEEVLPTKNACRANLYVITKNKGYQLQMRLRVTFPFVSAHDSASASEDHAEIVRLDSLPDGRTGIAILIQRSGRTPTTTALPITLSAPAKRAGERRFTVRHPVSATATIVDLGTETRLQGRCSDLSVAGCYIDTLNPFSESTTVNVQLTDGLRTVDMAARVITNHIGMGMGLVFEDVNPEQALILVDWLGNRGGSLLPVLASAKPELSASSNRELIIKLLQLLQTNGKMTPGQISSLVSSALAG